MGNFQRNTKNEIKKEPKWSWKPKWELEREEGKEKRDGEVYIKIQVLDHVTKEDCRVCKLGCQAANSGKAKILVG